MPVCPNTTGTGARTAGLTGTREPPFNAPERRKDDGADRRVISTTQHVKRAAACILPKINGNKLQVKAIDARQRNSARLFSLWTEAYFWGCLSRGVQDAETGFFSQCIVWD